MDDKVIILWMLSLFYVLDGNFFSRILRIMTNVSRTTQSFLPVENKESVETSRINTVK